MSAQRKIIHRGQRFKIAFARDASGAYPAEEFLDECTRPEQAQIFNLFRLLCDADPGAPRNPQKFGVLGDGIFEFKSFQIRIPFTYSEGDLILITHGFRKKKQKADPKEIERAKRILKEDAQACKVLSISDHRQRRRP